MLKIRKVENSIILCIFWFLIKKPKNSKYCYMENGVIFLCDEGLIYFGLMTLFKQCCALPFTLQLQYNITHR